jgi:hypothetical protein
MHSERAAALLAELRAVPGGRLCVRCASVRLHVDREDVLMAIRELVSTGHIVGGIFICSFCGKPQPVASLYPFGFFGFTSRDS